MQSVMIIFEILVFLRPIIPISSLHLRFLRIDGSTVVNERQTIIDTFSSDPAFSVMLLSTRAGPPSLFFGCSRCWAGGVGINLTCADTVILHDLDFNPQVNEAHLSHPFFVRKKKEKLGNSHSQQQQSQILKPTLIFRWTSKLRTGFTF